MAKPRKTPSVNERDEQERRLIEVLADEYAALHGAPPGGGRLDTLDKIYAAVHQLRDGEHPQPRTAICLSGGGIRSASFALGVLQAFAGKGLLERFHYLSTVSGGGYVGGWLTAWRRNNAAATAGLNARIGGLGREPPELRGLRVYSNYLTPKLGVLSADTWALAALYVRNLLLNWVVYLPLIVAVILVPILSQSVMTAAILWPPIVHQSFMGLGCLLLVLALYTSLRGRQGETRADRVSQGDFLRLELLPLYVAALLVCMYSVGAYHYDPAKTLISRITVPIAALGVAALYGLTWVGFAVRSGRSLRFDWPTAIPFLSWLAAGAIGGALIGWGLAIADRLMDPGGSIGIDHGIRLLVIFGVGWIAGSLFIAEAIYLGLTSYTPRGDDEREWLARSSGWFLALTLGWGVLSALVLFAADIRVLLQSGFWALFPVSAGAGAVAAGIGSSAQTLANLINSKRGESVSMTTILSVASLLFLVTMTIILATVLLSMLPWWASLLDLGPTSRLSVLGFALSAGMPAALAAAAAIALCVAVVLLASVPINVNRFSSHSLYRNRLARAFLGSARGDEGQDSPTRDPLTGFDAKDNPRMAELAIPADRPRLFHVVNMALNVVSGRNNAWQERKAEPFVVSPKVAGNEYVGFCRTDRFGAADGGITLGTCMAISGAAASPNQGYHSSPLIGLIMTLFNVRLGWWLGNPQQPAKAVRAGPRWGIFQVIKELFGLTDDESSYVYLSDGGHFENLGLYEMVRRRCHMIVVSDGGCDPNCTFEDLGNAVRKIWIDFGIRIDFRKIEIRKRGVDKDALYCALGRIYYPELKGSGKDASYVLYIKPGFHDNGTEPPDVCAYALANLTFPHETTSDQFFSESQMESYRSLGRFIADTVLGEPGEVDTTAPTEALQPYWKHLSQYIVQYDKQAAARPVG